MYDFGMRTYEPFKFLGRLFVVPLKVAKGVPPVTYAPTWEQEPPYRFGPTVVVRMPIFRVAWGIGVWLDTHVDSLEAERLERAEIEEANAAYDAYVAVNGQVPREEWESARRFVAEQGLDPDEEMRAMQDMGIFGGIEDR